MPAAMPPLYMSAASPYQTNRCSATRISPSTIEMAKTTGVTHMSRNSETYRSRWSPWKPGTMRSTVCGAKMKRRTQTAAIRTMA